MKYSEEMLSYLVQRVEALTAENRRLESANNQLTQELQQCQQREIHLVAQKR